MDLRELYQEVILDHNRKPRNFGALDHANCEAHGFNPLCGDDYHIRAVVDDGVVQDIRFDGEGCAISKAAASMMTVRVKGKPVEHADTLIEAFRAMMASAQDEPDEVLGHLRVFAGVAALPNRIKCAVLPWHTLSAALHGDDRTSTEGESDEWGDGFASPKERGS